MKKLLLIITVLSISFAGEMGLSAYGGLNMAGISYDPANDNSGMKPGLTLGVQYNKLPVILGAGISMRGDITKEYEVATVKMSGSSSYMYLDLSAIYPYAVGPGNVWAGLDIGINLSAEGTSDVAGTETTGDIEDVGMDYGLLFGYTYPLNETMGVSASYYFGLAEIVEDSKTKHNGIGVGISYILPF